MLSAGLKMVGFSLITSPAETELEINVLDWLAKLLQLPDDFLSAAGGIFLGILIALIGRVPHFYFCTHACQQKAHEAAAQSFQATVLQTMPLYTFSCFRVPEAICKKLDSIVRDFWWGHDQGVRKMHMLHWDKICLNRREGAKTFKAKYFPRCSIHDSSPKPHHSWFWRNIIKQGNPKLREGRWWVGKGLDIPLNHPDWFQCPTQNLQNPNLLTGTVADLIDHNTGVWKADLVRAVYPFVQCSEILSIPISKTGGVSDKLLWKHSSSGEYKKIKKANML
uniref:Uncharacterized protein n=1 Tax=Quercus lobata TaxID=97700 RepID=A0A7N2L005_QUELO